MKKVVLLILIFCQFSACAQKQSSLVLFLNSFSTFGKEENAVNFENIIFEKKNLMSKTEALTYVYDGDTTRLVCHGIYMDMETEEISGYYTDSVFPCKLGKIKIGKTVFVFYTTNECQNERDFWWTNVKMSVYDNDILQDSYIIYRANEYEAETNSILNIDKNLLFIQIFNNEKKIEYKLLRLSDKQPYVSVIKSIEKNKSVGDLLKALDILGWKEEFWQ